MKSWPLCTALDYGPHRYSWCCDLDAHSSWIHTYQKGLSEGIYVVVPFTGLPGARRDRYPSDMDRNDE